MDEPNADGGIGFKFSEVWQSMFSYTLTMNIMVSGFISCITIFLIIYYFCKTKKVKVEDVLPALPKPFRLGPPKPRFRKRDKVMFYGRQIIRKVRTATKNTILSEPYMTKPKRKIVMKLAKRCFRSISSQGEALEELYKQCTNRLLKLHQDQQPVLKVREPPPSFFEADQAWEPDERRLPPEVMYMLNSVRVFGHFERPLFLELCKHMESKFIPAGRYLFRIGDMDESIYVIQSGKVRVFITDLDGSEHLVKEVKTGDSIHSLLSIMDVLTGHPAKYKTVCARAVADTTILKLPAHAFQMVLERFPESLVRIVQIIMVRLQRVTFMALHNYLGLSYELINPDDTKKREGTKTKVASQSRRRLSVYTLTPKGSPDKSSTEQALDTDSNDKDESEKEEAPETVLQVTDYAPHESSSADAIKPSKDQQAYVYRHRMSLPAKKLVHMDLSGVDTGQSRGSVGNVEHAPSDFDAALSRARLPSLVSDMDPLAVGSPPMKIMEDCLEEEVPAASNWKGKLNAPLAHTAGLLEQHDLSDEMGEQEEEDHIIKLASQDLVQLFGLHDDSLLQGMVHLRYIPAGRDLIKQGEQNASLIFVVTGTLQVLQLVVGTSSEERSLFIVHPGEIVGALAVLTGEPSFFHIRARSDARVVTISKLDFYEIMKEQPDIVLNVAHTVVKRMSGFVRQIDFALDWMQVDAGRAIFRQGEHSDCFYIILNGRLRSVITQTNGKKELVGEYGRGELVGIVEVLTQTDRATTVMAVRDTELAKIPDELLNVIKRKYPQIVTRLIHLLGQRILGTLKNRSVSVLSEHPNVDMRPTVANLATVAVLPVSDDVPLFNFVLELQYALNGIGTTLRLNSDIIQNRLGAAALDSVNEYRLSSWLGQQEDIHRMVLYQCDFRMTPWTQRCIRQADCILIVALADQEPKVGEVETQLEKLAVRAQKELILLHKEDSDDKPRRTTEWLNVRGWCSSHHHIRCPKRVFSKRAKLRTMETYRRLFETEPDRLSDCSRLARFLTGTAVGLVLGGGGARGMAHVGIIKAMTEAGIPIDMVGGVSIGSFIGALWCEERNLTRFTQRSREWSFEMTSLWKRVLDLTYPVTSMFKGGSFNDNIEGTFKDRQIEDLWLPYFCITTDITSSKMRVHTNGSLWRYVRASMSLSGYLPPLCDPVDGHLLLDGGYCNNLPADIMKAMGAQTIFAIDVGSQDEVNLTNYGDELSGWWLLWKRWNPWTEPVKVPNMAEIQSRLAYVSCVRQMEQVKSSGYCEYIRPPIDKYQTLQFGSFDEIYDVGYHHGKALFSSWTKKDLIKEIFRENSKEKVKPMLHQTTVPAEAAFTDLAELVSRIDEPKTMAMPYELDTSVSQEGLDDEYEDIEENVPSRRGSGWSIAGLSIPKQKQSVRKRRSMSSLRQSSSTSALHRLSASKSLTGYN